MYWREDIPIIDRRERKKEKDRMRRERQSGRETVEERHKERRDRDKINEG